MKKLLSDMSASMPVTITAPLASFASSREKASMATVLATSANEKNLPEEPQKLSWKEKIDGKLWKTLESANDDEKIPVWLWFVDIDHRKIDEQIEKDTGLTAGNLAVDYKPVPKYLAEALESEKTDGGVQRDLTDGRFKAYVKVTEDQRKKEKQQTDTYIKAKRHAVQSAYATKNGALIKELKLPEHEITFQSQLTPSVTANLTKTQILDTVKSADVVSAGFYDDSKFLPGILDCVYTRDMI